MLFFNGTGIGNKLFDNVEVHQRFAAEEVNLEVVAGAGVFNEEVECALTYFKGHQRTFAVVLALRSKAVRAV